MHYTRNTLAAVSFGAVASVSVKKPKVQSESLLETIPKSQTNTPKPCKMIMMHKPIEYRKLNITLPVRITL